RNTSTGSGAVEPDYDVVIVWSGFGGSVAALRLSEKGYRVAVLEAGRRFSDEDFAARHGICVTTCGSSSSDDMAFSEYTCSPTSWCWRAPGSAGGHWCTPIRCIAHCVPFTPTPSGPTSPTGSANWLPTTTRRAACSEW